jgi:dTDP-4-amino-4,6-dideoxygalactose transaminase
MKIPCLDLKGQHQQIKTEIFEQFEKVYENTAFSGGPFVENFENAFAEYCEVPHAIAVNNGTNALHLALLALGIGEGDEVIIPANTFIATAWAVSYVGAKLVFAECNADTWELDINHAESLITHNTKAVIGVHLYGQPCDIDGIQALAKKHNLYFIEDAAQAQGAEYKGKRVGSFGDIACFSFYPGKNLGACGEGGACTTHSKELTKKIRRLRNHGCDVRYHHEVIGYNMRMGGLEGASLGVKIKYLTSWNDNRRAIAKRYINEISNDKIQMQSQPEDTNSVFHLFVVLTEDRDDFMSYLNKKDIYPGLHYPIACHLQNAYKHLGHKTGDFPVAENQASKCISLPMYAELTDEMVSAVIKAVNEY